MAIKREEIESIARCKANCVLAGIIFGFNRELYMRDAPTMTPTNVAGLVKEDELIVPHSELAKEVGAAGKKLIAWSVRPDGRFAQIVYEDEKACCGFTDGHPSEVLSPELLRVTKDLLHIEESGSSQGESLGRGQAVNDLLPMPPEQGPPLPRMLALRWPWKK